jgi:hypothetical protein
MRISLSSAYRVPEAFTVISMLADARRLPSTFGHPLELSIARFTGAERAAAPTSAAAQHTEHEAAYRIRFDELKKM